MKLKYLLGEKQGFSLVEMMIAVALSGIVIATIYGAYNLQKKTSVAQDQVVMMQQNLRIAMSYIAHDLRHAGARVDRNTHDASCNVGGTGGMAYPGFHTATATTIGFSMDLDGDGLCDGTPGTGKPRENVIYNLYNSGGVQTLGVKNPSTNTGVAASIEAIEFYYTLEDGTQTLAPAASEFDDIRSVQVSILARAEQVDPRFVNDGTYTTASGASWGPYNDNIRRRLLISTVYCRNMGM